MPQKPSKPCGHPGCPTLTQDRYCADHHRDTRQHDRGRGSSRERGYSARWDEYSRWFIRQIGCDCGRNHTLCERCQAKGDVELSELTDHIIPVRSGDEPGFWNHANHQALSRRCHSLKTAEDKAKGLTR